MRIQRMVDFMASVPFPLRLEPELKDRLEEAAREEGLSVNDMASHAISLDGLGYGQ
jgi:predicted HicB family RNase H-like nuclease